MLELAGYQENKQLYVGSRTIVYRAIRAKDSQPVIIKVLRNPHPSFKELVQFRNQYIITRNLENPRIVRPIALERYGNGYALVMPDDGAIALPEYWQQSEGSLAEFLSIAIQLAEALHYLSGQRIIHKDIKPANILINAEIGEVQLIDFSISSLLPRERQELINPNILEGTLAYISPEQTGRMNRGIDYRTDFYSLGATFFELLTGKLPFESSDPMELLHCHIARTPPALGNGEWGMGNGREVPQVLSEIVMKLMAKNAEDRYQSALGLKYDLERCQKELEATGEITEFELGTRDLCDRFLIPEKLYGRSAEVETLLAAFNRVAEGNTEMMLVAGFSGIGKTAVVNEVHKPIVRQRGYFIKGKFDQFNRNIPFSALVIAFRDLMGQLLGSTDAELQVWKEKILAAVGENGQVLVEVIPELEVILGKQPPVPELSGSAAQNRFNLLFQKFIAVFTTPEHPLLIFLDDLQWADSASLNLMKVLMARGETGYLLLLGAYRDNEVFPGHPLMLALNELSKERAVISTITLKPLTPHYVNQLVAETLICSPKVAEPLTEFIYQKTKGNPFFATQFLKGLHEDELIGFNRELGYWECDLVKVRDVALTDDVVEFMAGRLALLPEATQTVLKLAACIGNSFELETLATICEESSEEVASDIWSSLQEGLILPISEAYKFFQGDLEETSGTTVTVSYRFLHDRVQQAAYSLIPEDQKTSTHYRIGRLLLQEIPPAAQEERIFELVGQLNYGTALISEQQERDELAALNLVACRKARAATAYQAGREYASTGLSLLGEKGWRRQYEMSLALHDVATDLASLCGNFEEMEELFRTVIARSKSALEQVNVYRIAIKSDTSRSRLTKAIAVGKEILRKLGVSYPEKPTEEYIQQAIAEIKLLIGDRDIEDFAKMPRMTNPDKIAVVQIASSMLPAASASDPVFFPLLIALSVKVSIEYGNTEASLLGYAFYGFIACHVLQDVNAGVKFGQLALELLYQLDAKTVKAEVLCIVAIFSLHRKFHIRDTLPMLQEAYAAGLEVGNLEYAGYSALNFCTNSFWCGRSLVTLEQETRAYCNRLVQLNLLTQADYCRSQWQAMLNLLGIAEHKTILSGEAMQEAELLTKALSDNNLSGLYLFYFFKAILYYFFGEIESAREQAVEAGRYLTALPGLPRDPAFYLYDSLIALAALSLPGEETSELLARVEEKQKQLQDLWAQYAPMNHQHKVDLVEAEKCRVLGQKLEAIELYDKAISGAKANEYIQEEALANELAAKFYLDWGKEKIAATYMQEAYYCYAGWGAKAKIDRIETQYPQLLAPILQQTRAPLTIGQTIDATQALGTSTSSSSSSVLDVASAIKASQAISEEISLDGLLSKLMQIVLENAGADKGALILSQSGAWIIAAIGVNGKTQLANIPLEEADSLPLSIINTVKRSQKIQIVNEVAQDPTFAADTYLIKQQPISLFCSPILHQGELIGVLYLENNLTAGAFTQARVEVLNLLTAQAAISLENAQLYNTLEHKVKERTAELSDALEELRATQKQLVESEKMAALGGLVAGVAHEINTPIGTSITLASTLADETQNFLGAVAAGQLKRSVLNNYLELAGESTQLMLSNLHRAGELIQNFKQIATDQSNLEQRRFKIKKYLEEVALSLAPKLKQTPHTLTVTGDESITIESYPGALAQITTNLVTNSLTHAYPSEQAGQLRLEISREGDKVKIEYGDDGCGIDRENKGKIFEPFFTTARHRGGTGLGLHIVYNLVTQKLLGNIAVESEVGSGTRFAMLLPESVN